MTKNVKNIYEIPHFEENELKAEPIHHICKANEYSNEVDVNLFNAKDYYNSKVDNLVCDVLKTTQKLSEEKPDETVEGGFDYQYKQSLDRFKNNTSSNSSDSLTISTLLDRLTEKDKQISVLQQQVTNNGIGFCSAFTSFVCLALGLVGGIMLKSQ